MKKQFRTFVDPTMASEAIIAIIVFAAMIPFSIWILKKYVLCDISNHSGGLIAMLIWMLSIVIVIVLIAVNLFVCVIFTADGIQLKAPFRKAKTIPYWQFPNILRGRYFHWGFGREFIVFTNRRLSASDLNQINAFACGENFIKVKYSRRTYQKLCEILPVKQKLRLELLFPENKNS